MGPLQGIRIIEIQGLGPAPFAGMMLADMGAEVISVTRPGNVGRDNGPVQISERGKRSVALDLKSSRGVELLMKLADNADALIEGFRPGVAERLGFGPEQCQARNPRLVYGRMTGWGQTGPLAQAAGHDINYISLSGALHAIGRKGERPIPPLNLVGDFGGGGMLLAFGVTCALLEAQRSGQGEVVDASMVEGSALLMSMMYAFKAGGAWKDDRGSNMLDGAAHFYDTYETSDGKYVSIGSIEPQFYSLLMEKTGLSAEELGNQRDPRSWPEAKECLAAVFRTRTRDEWCTLMEGTDVCFAPVLSMGEAPDHPHNRERRSFLDLDGLVQPAPAPRFSRNAPEVAHAPREAGADTLAVLKELGLDDGSLDTLRAEGVIA
ncbi:MAG: CoA transferase [Ectothiorhodospiraceae bacterium]|nr:CoA transferase [Ectothiorhodospiraceae bacterium]MCH8503972.1 CoA transferase [Ectothiorhodospiraceae bacterium]